MDLVSSTHNFETAKVKIFPNPVRSQLNIIIDGTLNYSASIIDMQGNVVREFQNKQQINMGNLSNGTYILKITDLRSFQQLSKKIVVVK